MPGPDGPGPGWQLPLSNAVEQCWHCGGSPSSCGPINELTTNTGRMSYRVTGNRDGMPALALFVAVWYCELCVGRTPWLRWVRRDLIRPKSSGECNGIGGLYILGLARLSAVCPLAVCRNSSAICTQIAFYGTANGTRVSGMAAAARDPNLGSTTTCLDHLRLHTLTMRPSTAIPMYV